MKGNDTMLKGGVSFGINTLLHCVTAMKHYEQKSMEVRNKRHVGGWMDGLMDDWIEEVMDG